MTELAKKPMYSPGQVAACTLLAGPLAGAHLLWSNFLTLDQPKRAKITSIVAVSIMALLLVFAFATSSKNHSGLLIGVVLAAGARQVAEMYQLKKDAIIDSAEYSLQSNWKVFGIGLAWLALTILLVLFISFILTVAGVDFPE